MPFRFFLNTSACFKMLADTPHASQVCSFGNLGSFSLVNPASTRPFHVDDNYYCLPLSSTGRSLFPILERFCTREPFQESLPHPAVDTDSVDRKLPPVLLVDHNHHRLSMIIQCITVWKDLGSTAAERASPISRLALLPTPAVPLSRPLSVGRSASSTPRARRGDIAGTRFFISES